MENFIFCAVFRPCMKHFFEFIDGDIGYNYLGIYLVFKEVSSCIMLYLVYNNRSSCFIGATGFIH